jgi:ADYC domain-containing protein
MRSLFSLAAIAVPIALNSTSVVAESAGGSTVFQPVDTIRVEGTTFTIDLPDGRVLHSVDLIGANLLIKNGDRLLRVRIDGIETDPDYRASEGQNAVVLHSMSVERENGSFQPLCEAGPDGRRQAIPLRGKMNLSEGRFEIGGSKDFELACTAGAEGKCVRYGYGPWNQQDPLSLDRYNACIRMVRADYGGMGEGTTRNGMPIDVYDVANINSPEPAAKSANMQFEAGWTENGAVCVNHVRVAENISLEKIEKRWPRLTGLTGSICTEEFARSHGALILNRSISPSEDRTGVRSGGSESERALMQ